MHENFHGYLQLDQTRASLFFQVISQRYDNNSAIILTSNKAFSDWAEVFAGDAIMDLRRLRPPAPSLHHHQH